VKKLRFINRIKKQSFIIKLILALATILFSVAILSVIWIGNNNGKQLTGFILSAILLFMLFLFWRKIIKTYFI